MDTSFHSHLSFCIQLVKALSLFNWYNLLNMGFWKKSLLLNMNIFCLVVVNSNTLTVLHAEILPRMATMC